MSTREYKPRLSVELSEAQHSALKMLIPPNMLSIVVRSMVDTLIHLLRTHPNARINILNLIVLKELDLANTTYERATSSAPTE